MALPWFASAAASVKERKVFSRLYGKQLFSVCLWRAPLAFRSPRIGKAYEASNAWGARHPKNLD